MNLNKYTTTALLYALESGKKKKHVSLILRKGSVVSIGSNKSKTHPLAKKYGYRYNEVHSELDALIKYKGPKDNLVLVNFRFNRFAKMRMSKPCSLCLPWCTAVFSKIFYSTPEGMVMFQGEKHGETKEQG